MKQTLYWLDEKVLHLPLTQDRVVPTTVGEIFKILGDRRVEVENLTVETHVTTETEKSGALSPLPKPCRFIIC